MTKKLKAGDTLYRYRIANGRLALQEARITTYINGNRHVPPFVRLHDVTDNWRSPYVGLYDVVQLPRMGFHHTPAEAAVAFWRESLEQLQGAAKHFQIANYHLQSMLERHTKHTLKAMETLR